MASPAVALEVQQSAQDAADKVSPGVVPDAAAEGGARASSRRHDTFPSWFRLSAKLATLVLLLALPALALRDPKLTGAEEKNPAKAKFAILFMLLGTVAIPIWVPHVGTLVITFMAVIPICFTAIWVAYGLFVAYPNVYFLQISIVVFAFVLLYVATLVGVPAAIPGVFLAIYSVCMGNFLMNPRMAIMLSKVLSGALVLAAVLVTAVFSVVFPEYCSDLVWRGHHEGLEHLLHMAHHVVGSKPPRLLYRGGVSEARRLGSNQAARKALSAGSMKEGEGEGEDKRIINTADESDDDDEVFKLGASFSRRLKGGDRPRVLLTPSQRAERSYHRMLTAMKAGAKAVLGSKAELILGFCGSVRPVIPWLPIVPSPARRPDPVTLTVLRADAASLALALYKLHAALQLLDASTRPVLAAVRSESGASWVSLRDHMLAALGEVVGAFPQDAYPPPRRLDPGHVDAFQEEAAEVWGAWQRRVKKGDSGVTPGARLHATLMLQQLEGTGVELRRVHDAAQAAMDSLQAATYGFCGCRCCHARS